MAEQTPGIANKKLLLIAILLGLMAVVFYNIRVGQVAKEARGETLRLLQVVRDMEAGERVERKDIAEVEVETRVAKGLGNVLTSKDQYIIDRQINTSVLKGSWLMASYFTNTEENSPAAEIHKGMVKYGFPIDADQSPIEQLRPGDRVNIVGMLEIERDPLQAYRILENVRVMEVPSRRKLVVEVTPEVAQQLPNIRTYARGDFWVEVRNPTERADSADINPKLRDLKATVETATRRTIQ